MNRQNKNRDVFDLSDSPIPSTSKSRGGAPIITEDEEADINIIDSDDDISLAVRQTEWHRNDINPIEQYKQKYKNRHVSTPKPAADSEEEYVANFRLRQKNWEKPFLNWDAIHLARLIDEENTHTSVLDTTDNSDDEEIDVVNIPVAKRNRKMASKSKKIDKLTRFRKIQAWEMLKQKSARNVEEEEEIDVVNDVPSSSKFTKKVKYARNLPHLKVPCDNDEGKIDSDFVNTFSYSQASPVWLSKRLNHIRTRLLKCQLRDTSRPTPPSVTVNVSNSRDETFVHSSPLESYSQPDSDENMDVIDISDTSYLNNSEVVIVDDTSDEFSPIKRSPNSRRVNLGDCPICLEDFSNKEIMSTICGHVFCTQCIKGVIKTNKKCPNCRKTLTLKSIHPLFI